MGNIISIPGMLFFSNLTNLSKSEHDIFHITLDTLNHVYKGTNDKQISRAIILQEL